MLEGPSRIMAVSCKSWQQGFRPSSIINAIESNKKMNGREAWQGFRELTKPKWSEAFVEEVERATGSRSFTYVTAVSKILGEKHIWENYEPFRQAIGGNPIQLLTFGEMVKEILPSITTTLAATEVGRLLQMFRTADLIS